MMETRKFHSLGPLMTLIHFTLVILGLALVLVWLMYSAGVHGHFRFRWDEWKNWMLIAAILLCLGLPLRNLIIVRRHENPRP